MGLDLKLLPFEAECGGICFSHTILTCDRDRDLFDRISKIPAKKVPREFCSYLGDIECKECEERHYGNTQKTPYGNPLTWVFAEELAALEEFVGPLRNTAILAYLETLDPMTKVALYWS